MCGLVGFIRTGNGEFKKADLININAAMVSRGPDSEGIWIADDNVAALAHRRLSIIDLSQAASQPMHDLSGRFSIVFNGEIYNYKQLQHFLSKNFDAKFRTDSDTEVLLQLYIYLGADMLLHLRGMYAFLIYDNLKKEMFAARDHFGIKPLYFTEIDGNYWFASQVKALAKHPRFNTDKSAAAQIGFLLLGAVPEPFTMYAAVKVLEPGSWMRIDINKNVQCLPYFKLNELFLQSIYSDESNLSIESKRQLLRSAFQDSISAHLVADVPVGCFLSSGLDSTVITAVAAEQHKQMQTVTLQFEDYANTPLDESIIAAKTAHYYSAKHSSTCIGYQDFIQCKDHILESMDQPSIDGVNTYFVSKIASDSGLKVALSGLGGDELFRSYAQFDQTRKAYKLGHLIARSNQIGKRFRQITYPLIKNRITPKYAGLLEYSVSHEKAYLLSKAVYMPWELDQLLPQQLVKEGLEALDLFGMMGKQTEDISDVDLKTSALEYSFYLRNQLLRDSDWASMAHSLELRTPLVDIEFVKKVLPLVCGEFHLTKKDFISIPQRSLPEFVLNRPKKGFLIPVKEWISKKYNLPVEKGYRSWSKYLHLHFFES